jgi:glycosyltransferase involved in cell wall biosynthesis
MKRLLALCDSPTAQTGFARVAQNLLRRWLAAYGGPFDVIDVWGINYRGDKHPLPYFIYDAGDGGQWQEPVRLAFFLNALCGKNETGDKVQEPYTHVWILQDSFCLARNRFAEGLKVVCEKFKIRSSYYLPVDGTLEPEWMTMVANVDATVAYTEFGKAQALKALPASFNPAAIKVIPHGVETKVYFPIEDRVKKRRELFRPYVEGAPKFLNDEDFLIVNVNANQRRKDLPRTLRIFKELVAHRPAGAWQFKLCMHMPRESADQINLSKVANQIGLVEGLDWMCSDFFFTAGTAKLGEEHIRNLYNTADMMLTTTLGEGWGFALTEALACGCPIAAPRHTACEEIMTKLMSFGMDNMILPLPVEEFGVVNAMDNSRFRPVTLHEPAIRAIEKFVGSSLRPRRMRLPLTDAAAQWLNWDRIAKEWEPVLLGS